jgi:hypothetical protein
MATQFGINAKNVMLDALKNHNPGGGETIYIGAFMADADGALAGSPGIATYAAASGGTIQLSGSVNVEVPASTTVNHIRIFKEVGGAQFVIYKKDITPEVFTNAGFLIFEEATITLAG